VAETILLAGKCDSPGIVIHPVLCLFRLFTHLCR